MYKHFPPQSNSLSSKKEKTQTFIIKHRIISIHKHRSGVKWIPRNEIQDVLKDSWEEMPYGLSREEWDAFGYVWMSRIWERSNKQYFRMREQHEQNQDHRRETR